MIEQLTPPPQLVRQWATTNGTHYEDLATLLQSVATQAARWGADQELEACCEWLNDNGYNNTPRALRAARRPEPPSPKEEALQVLENLIEWQRIDDPEYQALRHALEQLDD